MEKKYDNIFLQDRKITAGYRSPAGGKPKDPPKRNHRLHGKYLIEQIKNIENLQKNESVFSIEETAGMYLEFEGKSGFDLKTESLEDNRANIRLVNIRREEEVDKATVYIPKGKEAKMIKKITEYYKSPSEKKIKNKTLVASIEQINSVSIKSFWIGKEKDIPGKDKVWCEIWLRTEQEQDLYLFKQVVEERDLDIKKDKLIFPERTVVLVRTNNADIEYLIKRSNLVAEVRKANISQVYFQDLLRHEQIEWERELRERIDYSNKNNIYISILDTGINNTHLLLKDVLLEKDIFKYEEAWNIGDHVGHGTAMAGVVTYGDLYSKLETQDGINLQFNLESMKILPDNSSNNPELYGAITVDAVSTLYIENPHYNRSICIAITEDNNECYGEPNSWSAAVDSSSYGDIDKQKKLYVVSAGNIRDYIDKTNYPEYNTINLVQAPGQAWNAITVGAYTEKDQVEYESYGLRRTLAKAGAISPYSRTSVLWDSKKWPIKPEVVFEGGNMIVDNSGNFGDEQLESLTLNNIKNNEFTTINGTSSATAFASNFIGILKNRYPDAWPETIRGLMIHSAEWTKQMKEQFLTSNSKKAHKLLLRTCGYGVPNLKKALNSAENSVNLIIESELYPFKKVKSNIKINEVDIHEIPWPKETLEELYDENVRVKVTLSYFIEPAPGEVGWKDKYRYQSCGLRFKLNGKMSAAEFKAKISVENEIDEDEVTTSSGIDWELGTNNRDVGSIHSDRFTVRAIDLIDSNYIAVYPVGGWWKDRKKLERYHNKIRYSLVITLETPKAEAMLYTEIKNQIKIKNKVKIESKVEIKIK
ncbi:MAG: S8 family peptidase [Sarcina sp.]